MPWMRSSGSVPEPCRWWNSSYSPIVRWPMGRDSTRRYPRRDSDRPRQHERPGRPRARGWHRLAALVLEARDADAQQPHRPRRRVGAEQLDGDVGDRRLVVDEGVDRPGARHRRPVVEAHLDADGPPAGALALQRLRQLARLAAQDL